MKDALVHSINFTFAKLLPDKLYVRAAITIVISVPRLGDILDFGQLFKAFGNN